MPELITISNGSQFFQIPEKELPTARARGFYRPHQRKRTIVSNGKAIFEISLSDLAAARADGFQDMLAVERDAGKAKGSPSSKLKVVGVAAPVIATNVAPPVTAGPLSVSDQVSEEVAQAEEERQAELEELLQEIEEAEGFEKVKAYLRLWWFNHGDRVTHHARGSGVSVALHIAILLILASMLLANEKKEPRVLTVAVNDEVAIEEQFLEPQELEVTEPEETVEPISESAEVVSEVTEELVSTDFTQSLTGDLLAAPKASGSKGDGDAKPAKAKVQFFGSKTEAVDFVFVIDNSNSMTKGRFETALNELIKAVEQLNARQKFYVIFFSDTAYPLFHPTPARQLVPATKKNKELLVQWLATVQLCLRTQGKEALELGFSLKPDVMFVLGDGAFTDKASVHFSKNPVSNVVVHTLGMEVSTRNAEGFKALAEAHKGTYRDVGVHPQGALLAKSNPRKKNNLKNGIWGIKLGQMGNFKK